MLHYVYGIVDGSTIERPIPYGHEGDEISLLQVNGLAAAVSRSTRTSLEASGENVWRHEKIINSLMKPHSVLPMRFGMICKADELTSLIRARYVALRADLAKVRGKVEMALRIKIATYQDSKERKNHVTNSKEKISGMAFLLDRMESIKRTKSEEEFIRDVKAHLETLTSATVWLDHQKRNEPIKVSCLVEREYVPAFISALKKLNRPDISLSCTGPWAPYSFIGNKAALGV